MSSLVHRFFVGMLILGTCGCSPFKDFGKDVALVSADDAEMNAAMATAKSKLPEFWKSYASPGAGESDFGIKVPVKDGGQVEFFWLGEVVRQNGRVTGTIGNDPELVKNVKLGQTVEYPESEVVDWMYLRNGKIVGNYTARALMKTLPADEAAQLKEMLLDP